MIYYSTFTNSLHTVKFDRQVSTSMSEKEHAERVFDPDRNRFSSLNAERTCFSMQIVSNKY